MPNIYWDRILFICGLLAVAYMSGLATMEFKLFPYKVVRDAGQSARDWLHNWAFYTKVDPIKHIRPAVYAGDGVVRHDRERVEPGVTLFSGLRNNHIQLWLVDMNGNVLHEWPADFTKLWPDARHVRGLPLPANEWLTHTHGALLFPEGDVVFNFDGLGMLRLDKCGNVVWKVPYMTHHSLHLSRDGTIWASANRFHDEESPEFPGMKPNFIEPIALQVSPDGAILREVSLLRVIYQNGAELLRFSNQLRGDWDHLNDVEVFEAEAPPSSSPFKQGDIMVSFRNMHLIMVFDPETSKIRWISSGPWLAQHDPDFLPDGTISVFDNHTLNQEQHFFRPLGGKSPEFDGSRIIRVDPVTSQYRVVYKGSGDNEFFSNVMGKHQYLENGNILVTQAEGGRAFEIDPDGKIVWEYINRYDQYRVAVIEQAQRYPLSYGSFAKEVVCDD